MYAHEYVKFDAIGLAELVSRREVKAIELVETAISQIEQLDPILNAMVYRAFDEAIDGALCHDTSAPHVPFYGVPFLMKDAVRPVKGWPGTWGSRFGETGPAVADCELVQRYRAAGVLMMGSTNVPEFGIPGVTNSERLGPCRNPWDLERNAGGSSGGSAAAVASGMVPIAHGNDGGGSLRIPAACCGLVGLKPTRDRNPADPDMRWQFRGHIADHILSRTVRDTAVMLDATGYPQAATPYAPPPKTRPYAEELAASHRKIHIRWSTENAFGTVVHPAIQEALGQTVSLLEGLGHDVRAGTLKVDYRTLYSAHQNAYAAGFSAKFRRIVERVGHEPRDTEIGQLGRRLYERGKSLSAIDALDAFQTLRTLSWHILQQFETFDVYLTPVMAQPAPPVALLDPATTPLDEFDRLSREHFPFTLHFNVTGQPSISLPLGQSSDGLPIGMLFTARYGDEATLIRLAAELERANPWAERRPPAINSKK
jgi:amidase